MKKLTLLCFSFLMALALNGCGGKDSAHESTDNLGSPATSVNTPLQGSNTPSPSPSQMPPVQVGNGNSNNGQKNKGPVHTGGGNNSQKNNGPAQTSPVCDSSGPIGNYSGYLTESDGSLVPLTLKIDINKSPSTTGSQLKASLQVGLFGGVPVATDTAVYTFSDGSFIATFAPATVGGTALKLYGKIKCGVFVDTQLQGKASYSVALSKGSKSPFDNRQEFKYEVSFPTSGSKAVKGIMTVKRFDGTVASNDFSDLPTIANLATTFQFNSWSTVVTDWTHYDPLTGTLLVSMGGQVSYVNCQSVNLKKWSGELEAPSLTCDVTSGASAAQKMSAVLTSKTIPVSPQYLSGKWIPANSKVATLDAYAEIEYTGQDGKNPSQYLFPSFPILSLKVSVCENGVTGYRFPMMTVAEDQVMGQAIFRETVGSNANNIADYRPIYSFGWSTLAGQVLSNQSDSLSPTIAFDRQISLANWHGCGDQQ